MLNWEKMIDEHNAKLNYKCLGDKNPLVFRVKLKSYDEVLTFTSANKAFGDYGGFSVFAYDTNDNCYRIEQELFHGDIVSIERV